MGQFYRQNLNNIKPTVLMYIVYVIMLIRGQIEFVKNIGNMTVELSNPHILV